MPVSTNRVIRLSFLTSGGKSAGITLSNPKQGLTKEVARSVMETILAKNAFITASGELVGIKDIKIVDTVTEDLYDPLEP
ncbi:MAG TPA: DUF2922 domain-containing protein [Desulfitobacterium dehalogenans]|uniref:DUF2922 domain-containing protein n=1 Tax=Desulfitobacterium dehalogenans TaxID=36854 RepID=A0A7C6Z393_9FIRM|nr:DUF2922 domain-containing protein [Desulfitobacterium dehalogenans]